MKVAIIYSSKTGNTRQVGEAIQREVAEAKIYSVTEAPAPENFDLIFIGYWADRGTANKEAINYMQKIVNKKVAVFFTLGAYPDSSHAHDCFVNGCTNFGEGCSVLGEFHCQGAIDPALIEMMKKLPPGTGHDPTPERQKRWQDAASHPDDQDLENAKFFARQIMEKFSHI